MGGASLSGNGIGIVQRSGWRDIRANPMGSTHMFLGGVYPRVNPMGSTRMGFYRGMWGSMLA